jgi:DNA-binding beta-propeller fold protein YncE
MNRGNGFFRSIVAMLFAGFLLAGCSSAPPVKERFYWPRLPETPRIEWLGTYWNSKDMSEYSFFKTLIETEEPVTLNTPFAVASDGNGRVYVGDLRRGGVVVFDFNRKTTELLGEESLERPTYPTGVAVGEDGTLFVGDGRSLGLFIYQRDGRLKRQVNLGDKVKSFGSMTVDTVNKRLLIPDVKEHKIAIFNLNGEFVSSLGKGGTGEGEFLYPTAVAVDKEGSIYVCDSQNARVQKFSSDGKFLRIIGKRGDRPGDLAVPKGVALDSEGHIYVTDGKLNYFIIYGQGGEYLLSVGAPYSYDGRRLMPAGFNIPQGIAIDKNDTIYIADQMNGRMQVFQYLNEEYLKKHPVSEGRPAKELGDEKPTRKK